MYKADLHISFLSAWHIGSGMGHGPVADSILNRDDNGLPFITGRTIKGALREGAWRLGLCGRTDLKKLVQYLFGSRPRQGEDCAPGCLYVSMGVLPEDLRNWLLSHELPQRKLFVSDMTTLRAQTALDPETKTAMPQSLRTIECGIPGLAFTCQLYIDAPDLPSDWLALYMPCLCAAVKSMGGDRARGLGLCNISVAGNSPAPIKLPPICPRQAATSQEAHQ